MMHIKFYSLVLPSLLYSACALANEGNQFNEGDEFADYFAKEELVSIATGTSTPLSKAPSVANVISSERIEAMGATRLSEVLERIPGLHVMRSNLSRLDPVYSIRGIHTGFNPQILFLLNGIEIKHNYNGGLAFTFEMPVENISRIEVIRGPGSAIYGADAYSGVINIITRTAEENLEGNAGIRGGSFNSRDLWLRKGYVDEDKKVSFSLSNQISDGDKGRIVQQDSQSFIDPLYSLAPGALQTQYDITNLNLSLSTGHWVLDTWLWDQDQAGLGQGGALALDTKGYQNASQWLTHLGYTRDLSDSLKVQADLSYLRTNSDSYFVLFPAGATLPVGSDGNAFSTPFAGMVTFTDGYIGNPKSTAESTALELSALYNALPNHSIRLAAGWSQDSIDTREYKNFGPGVIDGSNPFIDGTLTNVTGTDGIYLQNQTRNTLFASVQDQWRLNNDWSFTAGIRWDRYSDFGSTLNPRLALVWETHHNLTTKLLYGAAFRAPSFGEQHLINNPAALGNPDLKPEEIETWELALDYRPNFDTNIKLNLFTYEARDLIAVVPDGSTLRYQNARNQDGRGLELEIDWHATDSLGLYANYAYQHSVDALTGKRIHDAPTHSTYMDIRYRPDAHWLASMQHYWVGSRVRASGDTRGEIPNYHWVNMKLARTLDQQNMQLAFTIKNLFDTTAYEPSSVAIPGDYPLEGRSLWAELVYTF
jgi:outer membrane receptor for ferrienterochelin and colicins